MLKPKELGKRRLENVVQEIVDTLYLDGSGNYNPDKEWDSGDTLQAIADTLRFYDLDPDEPNDGSN